MDNSIPALERALDVLDAVFARPGGVSAAQLVAETRIPRTTLYRILRVLSGKGYVVSTNGNGTYVLGHALIRMASGVTRQTDLVSAAVPAMEALGMKVGETVKLVLREGMESFTIAVKIPFDGRVASQLGARGPLHIGASQRLLLSRAPASLQAKLLSRPLVRAGPGSITNVAQLRKNLADLALRDWEIGRDEGIQGIATVAALVRESGHEPRAAIAVVFIVDGKSERDIAQFKSAVRETARSLSRFLGGT